MGKKEIQNPIDNFLNADKKSSVWCPGCGIGIVVNAFLQTISKLGLSLSDFCVASSGIGCTGKIIEHLNTELIVLKNTNLYSSLADFRHKNQEKKLIVFLNECDLMISGIDGLLNICHQGMDLTVIFINSFTYHLFIEHREFSSMPFRKNSSSDASDSPLNIPLIIKNCGASFMARWTPLHCRRLMFSMKKAFNKQGFSFIEVLSPCLMYHASDGNLGKKLDRMGILLKNSTIEKNENPEELEIRKGKKFIIGNFIDK